MATVENWNPHGVALDISASVKSVTRTSATQFTVSIGASWSTHWSGARTNYEMKASSGGGTSILNPFGTYSSGDSGTFTGTYYISGNAGASKDICVTFTNTGGSNAPTGPSVSYGVWLNVSVPALPSYAVLYNGNGGTGAPGRQLKWKDQSLALSSTKPTRTGYTFVKWNTNRGGTGTSYNPGATYTANAAVTLYAVWKINTWTVSYNANGGTGAPGSQTKTYGQTLTLSSTKPTRKLYNFKGWATSAGSNTPAYQARSAYTENASVTLYAIWEIAYIAPRITSLSVWRVDASGNAAEDGTSYKLLFKWETDKTSPTCKIEHKESTASTWSTASTTTLTGTSGTFASGILGASGLNSEKSYDIRITIADSLGNSSRNTQIAPVTFSIDFKAGGKGVAFGKPASVSERIDSAWPPTFAPTLIGGTELASSTDLNALKTPGNYICSGTDVANTLVNCPTGGNAFRLEVSYAYNAAAYLFQRVIVPSNSVEYFRRYDANANAWETWTQSNPSSQGSLKLTVSGRARTPFKMFPGTSSGDGIQIGAGGRVVVGGGESAANFVKGASAEGATGATEDLVLTADKAVYIDTDMQKGYASRQRYAFGRDGQIVMPNGVKFGAQNKVLATPNYFMNENQTVNLSKAISAQVNGIVLVWSYFNSSTQTSADYDFIYHFISKSHVASYPGKGIFVSSVCEDGNMCKYIYPSDTSIKGYANNQATTSYGGVTFNNDNFVLRQVIGV
jgi:uncharacterized repeat protein (TIGR02543 family)